MRVKVRNTAGMRRRALRSGGTPELGELWRAERRGAVRARQAEPRRRMRGQLMRGLALALVPQPKLESSPCRVIHVALASSASGVPGYAGRQHARVSRP